MTTPATADPAYVSLCIEKIRLRIISGSKYAKTIDKSADKEMLPSEIRVEERECFIRNTEESSAGPLANCINSNQDAGWLAHMTAFYTKCNVQHAFYTKCNVQHKLLVVTTRQFMN